LMALIRADTVDAINTNGPALHAIWTLSGLGLLDGNHPQPLRAVMAALKHRAPGGRKAAVQTLPAAMPGVAHALLASGVLDDPDNRVRLAAYLALIDADGTTEIGKAIVNAASDSRNVGDRWLTRALELLARAHEPFFSDAYAARFGPDDRVEPAGLFIHRLMAGDGSPDGDTEPPGTVDQVVQLRAQLGKVLYDKQSFTVKAGSTVTIVFANPNYMQHNL